MDETGVLKKAILFVFAVGFFLLRPPSSRVQPAIADDITVPCNSGPAGEIPGPYHSVSSSGTEMRSNFFPFTSRSLFFALFLVLTGVGIDAGARANRTNSAVPPAVLYHDPSGFSYQNRLNVFDPNKSDNVTPFIQNSHVKAGLMIVREGAVFF